MLIKYKFQLIMFSLLCVGIMIVNIILDSFQQAEKEKYDLELRRTQNETILSIETGIDVYKTLVSGLRSFLKNSPEFPTEKELHYFLHDLVKDTEFTDSIVVSWVDTNQIFRYAVTPRQIDPFQLKGATVKNIRPKHEIKHLDRLMNQPAIELFPPINLIEGWAAFPFNFSVKNKNGVVIGYIAPVVNVKYLLNKLYQNSGNKDYVYQFSVNDSIYFNREKVFDGTKCYNKKIDHEDFKNYQSNSLNFIHKEIKFFNLKIKVGVAHKKPFSADIMRPIFMYSWYLLLIIFSFIIFFQLNKNKRITDELVLAHNELSEKNKVLETNVFQVKTLVKEVHHRVKNNLQIISSLLNLQGNTEEDSKVVNALQKSNNRIQSIALVHQKLYGTETLVQVDVYEYVAELIGNLSISLADDSKDLKIEIQISKELHFTMDTIIPLGLILNELITNSFKYAFTNLDSGTILIEIAHIQGNRYKLTFSDSGKGFDETIDIIKPKSLGLELIIMLSEQLKGSIMIDKKTATFEIEFQIL